MKLQPNHKRSFSSSLFLLEKLMEEVKTELSGEQQRIMQKTEKDLSENKRKEVLQAVERIEDEIAKLSRKYELTRQEIVESHFLNSRKSKAWEILNDSLSKHMRGFGEFPPELAAELDADIERLLKLLSGI